MEKAEFYAKIGLPPEMADKLRRAAEDVDLPALEPELAGLLESAGAEGAYTELIRKFGDDPDGVKMLLCQLESARRDRERYAAAGLSEDIYIATMRCFSRFIHETERRTGCLAFDRGWWTWRQTSMRLFRVGALEYELRELRGERVISLHIPSDADLSSKAVDSSLNRAKTLLSGPFGGWGRVTCNSWLLSPALTPLLSEKSNIRAFQRRFEITEWDGNAADFMGWIFEVPENTPLSDLPTGTSLQRAVREHLSSGGKIGSAMGWMKEGENYVNT